MLTDMNESALLEKMSAFDTRIQRYPPQQEVCVYPIDWSVSCDKLLPLSVSPIFIGSKQSRGANTQ